MLKQLTVLAASVVSAAAFAGGAAGYNMSSASNNVASSNNFAPSMYLEANGGYDWTGYKNAGVTTLKNDGNTWNAGLDFGYTFMPGLALEVGGNYMLPLEVKGTNKGLNQFDIYAGLKMSTQIMSNVNLYAKAAADYLDLNDKSSGKSASSFQPTVALGADYCMNQWNFGVQWRHIIAVTKKSVTDKVGNTVPAQDLFNLVAGYTFPVGA